MFLFLYTLMELAPEPYQRFDRLCQDAESA